jgi:hypothetical protein
VRRRDSPRDPDGPAGAVKRCTMKTNSTAAPVTRASLMKLMSDEEVARVSNAESQPRLLDGDEYLDLVHLDQGVLHADTGSIDMTHIVPKKAVHLDTWAKLVAHLPARH